MGHPDRATRKAVHTHLSHAHIPPRGRADARIHTPGAPRRAPPAPRKIPCTRPGSPRTTAAPASTRRAPRSRTLVRTPHRSLGSRPGLPGALHTPAVSPHIPAARSPAQRESPGRAPPPPPRRPRRPGCAPPGGPGSTTWNKFLRFLILGGVRWAGVGEPETAAWAAPAGPSAGRSPPLGSARRRRPLPLARAGTGGGRGSSPLPGLKPRGAHLPSHPAPIPEGTGLRARSRCRSAPGRGCVSELRVREVSNSATPTPSVTSSAGGGPLNELPAV